MNITEEEKQAALEAGKQGAQAALEKSKNRNLKWWERLIWVLLCGVAAAVAQLLAGCGHDVSVESGHAEICKDGSCLVLDKGTGMITFTQRAPKPEDMQPTITNGDK